MMSVIFTKIHQRNQNNALITKNIYKLTKHEYYMARCLEIAQSGLILAMPNPSVGAVIVYNDEIIGEGFTSAYGGAHGEVNAFASVKNEALLKHATLYVSLEPCSHFGKTPPCCDLVILKKIKKVVIGTVDPFSEVSGRGIQKLKDAGIEVIVGVLEKECLELNKRFFTFHQKKRPYIILKWANTLNGFIAPNHRYKTSPVWITNHFTRQWVHKLRAAEQGILVGNKTVLEDNPKLNTRDYFGKSPVRIILDQHLKVNNKFEVLNSESKTIVINGHKTETKNLIFYEKIDYGLEITSQINTILYKHNIQSVIIEGGTKTLQTYINANMWDEAFVCIGNIFFNDGILAPQINKKPITNTNILQDKILYYKNDIL